MKKNSTSASQPIGIFDSGIGGLTVANAIAKRLPNEDFIYFGDTAHLPYGDKSASTIQKYCEKIVDFLLLKQCKVIVIACNSASAAAFDHLQHYLCDRALLLSVIDPVVDYIRTHIHDSTIGLIGTRQTVNSQVFAKKIAQLPNRLQFKAVAAPLLVSLIEESFHEDSIVITQVLKRYLNDPRLSHIDYLILGCTHYPVIKKHIAHFFENETKLLDESEITAEVLAKLLGEKKLLNSQAPQGKQAFYVSDLTPAFAQMAKLFFGNDIQLHFTPLKFREEVLAML